MLVTALVTPFRDGGEKVDLDRWQELVTFQLESGADKVLVAGSTGEGAALEDDERAALLDAALEVARPEQVMMSIGAMRVTNVIARGRQALKRGVRDLLLADCPYTGPSSAALREGWFGPAATALSEARLFPYCIPGRTGAEMLPDDLARLHEDHPNVVGVKDASGRLSRMTRVRELCGDGFLLLAGDDHLAYDALVDPTIRAHGACSFVANLVPGAMASLVHAARHDRPGLSRELHEKLELLLRLVSVTTEETVEVNGEPLQVPQRARNPVPVKTALQMLGVLAEGCRDPLMEMGPKGAARVRSSLRLTARRAPEVLTDLSRTFGVDVGELAGNAVERTARGARERASA